MIFGHTGVCPYLYQRAAMIVAARDPLHRVRRGVLGEATIRGRVANGVPNVCEALRALITDFCPTTPSSLPSPEKQQGGSLRFRPGVRWVELRFTGSGS
jgi:hypothetical protein